MSPTSSPHSYACLGSGSPSPVVGSQTPKKRVSFNNQRAPSPRRVAEFQAKWRNKIVDFACDVGRQEYELSLPAGPGSAEYQLLMDLCRELREEFPVLAPIETFMEGSKWHLLLRKAAYQGNMGDGTPKADPSRLNLPADAMRRTRSGGSDVIAGSPAAAYPLHTSPTASGGTYSRGVSPAGGRGISPSPSATAARRNRSQSFDASNRAPSEQRMQRSLTGELPVPQAEPEALQANRRRTRATTFSSFQAPQPSYEPQVDLKPGSRVQAFDLERAPHLNGAKGIVVGVQKDRYLIFFREFGAKSIKASNLSLVDATPKHASLTLRNPLVVRVVAPGAGTKMNGAVYTALGRDPAFNVEVWGDSRTPYDRYPEDWPGGDRAPNLESFAQDLMDHRLLESSDCLIFGSRGGQVVLPYLWKYRGADVPPAIVINGGCAGNLPQQVHWPIQAISIILIGGQDEFRGNFSYEEYIADTKAKVPAQNMTTAVLFVNEMYHMPQSHLLGALLPHFLAGLISWQASRSPPLAQFDAILCALMRGGFNGRLSYKGSQQQLWEEVPFSSTAKLERPSLHRTKTAPLSMPDEPAIMQGQGASLSHLRRSTTQGF